MHKGGLTQFESTARGRTPFQVVFLAALSMVAVLAAAAFAPTAAHAESIATSAGFIDAAPPAFATSATSAQLSTATKKTDLGKVNWTWTPGKHVYTGRPVEPNWLFRIGGKPLTNGKDYTVTYAKNVNAGKASTTLTGKGSYTGKVSFSFTISPADLGGAIIGRISDRSYTGKAVTPSPALTYNGRTLKKGIDYKLSYKNNVKTGKASVTATGMGNFAGTKTTTFRIVKKSPSLKWATSPSTLYKSEAKSFKATSSAGSKGAVTYTSSNAKVATVNAKTGAVKAVGVGDVTITAKIAEKGVYSSQSVTRSIRVKARTSNFMFCLYGKNQGDNCIWDDLRVGSTAVSGSLRSYVKTDSAAAMTYYSSTPEVFNVDAQGRYTAKRPGYARVCIAQRSNDYYPASHVFVNVAVKTPDGRDVSNLEWQACDAVASAAWATLGAGTALGQGNLPVDTVVGAVLGADTGNALYGLPQLNSVLTDVASRTAEKITGGNAYKALSRIVGRYGIKTGVIGVCTVGTIAYVYHLSENANHTWRFQHDASYRESAEGLMREESWQDENGWLETYRIGQLEGWLGTQSTKVKRLDVCRIAAERE